MALSSSPRHPLQRHRSKHRGHHSRTSKNKTVTTADVLATSVSAEALLLSSPPMYRSSRSSRAEAASSPMSPVTLTSVEINETVPMTSMTSVGLEDVSPSRFSSNSINTVILNPGVVSASTVAATGGQVDEGEDDIRT